MQKIFLFILVSLMLITNSFSQILGLEKEIDRIPVYSNGQFIDFLNKKFDDFTKQKPDTLLLIHTIHTGYGTRDYALIFKKKGTLSQVYVVNRFQVIPITNDTLKTININRVYQIFDDDFVRTIDTNIIISHNDIICGQFYFGNKKKLYVGYYGIVFYMLDMVDPKLRDAYIEVSNRFR